MGFSICCVFFTVVILLSIFAGGKKIKYVETLLKNEVESPTSVWVNKLGDLFITDPTNYRVVKVDVNNTITTVAGIGIYSYIYVDSQYGSSISSKKKSYELPVYNPQIIRGDSDGNIYFTDSGFHKINMVTPNYRLKTIAGNYYGTGIYCGTPQDGTTASGSSICNPYGLHVDDQSRDVYFTERSSCRVYRIVSSTGLFEHIAGSYCSYSSYNAYYLNMEPKYASWYIGVIWVNSDGDVFVTLPYVGKVAKITRSANVITDYFGSNSGSNGLYESSATSTYFPSPQGLTGDSAGNIYVYGQSYCQVRKVSTNGWSTHFAGSYYCGYSVIGDGVPASSSSLDYITDIYLDSNFNYSNLYLSAQNRVRVIRSDGLLDTVFAPVLSNPYALWKDTQGTFFIADTGNSKIVTFKGGQVETLLGSSTSRMFIAGEVLSFSETYLSQPSSIVGDNNGHLFFGDRAIHSIFVADLIQQTVRIVAGRQYNCYYNSFVEGVNSNETSICQPGSISLFDSHIYFVESSSCRIMKFPMFGGPMTIVAGSAWGGCNYYSEGYFIDQSANSTLGYMDSFWINAMGDIFATMQSYNRVVKISPMENRVVTIAGDGRSAYSSNWFANESSIPGPSAICGDDFGNLYVFSSYYYRIQWISEDGYLLDYAGNGGYGEIVEGPAAQTPLTRSYGFLCNETGLEYILTMDKVSLSQFYDRDVQTSGHAHSDLNMSTIISSEFIEPSSVWEDNHGSLFIADSSKYQIVKVDIYGNTTIIAGLGYYSSEYVYSSGSKRISTLRSYELPIGYVNSVRGDRAGNIYFADSSFNKINRVSPLMKLRTLTGTPYGQNPTCNYYYDGDLAVNARICNFGGLHVDEDTSDVFFTERNYCRVVKVEMATGLLRVIAGSSCSYQFNGAQYYHGVNPLYAQFYPHGIWVNTKGDVYFTAPPQGLILKITNDTNNMTIYGGCGSYGCGSLLPWQDGPSRDIRLQYPYGIGGDSEDNIYVTANDCRMRRFSADGQMTRIIGTGTCSSGPNDVNSTESRMSWVNDLFVTKDNSILFAEYDRGFARKISADGIVSVKAEANLVWPMDIWVDGQGNMFVAMYYYVVKFDVHGRRTVIMGDLQDPTIDTLGDNYDDDNYGFNEEYYMNENKTLPLRMPLSETKMYCPYGIVGDNGGRLFVTDNCFHQIYLADLITGEATVIGGRQQQSGYSVDGEISYEAYLAGPWSIALYEDDVYFTEWSYCRIRMFHKFGGELRTIAGSGSCGMMGYLEGTFINPFEMLYYPMSLFVNSIGEVFFTSSNANKVFKLSSTREYMTVFAGDGVGGYSTNVAAVNASISSPSGICGDEATNSIFLYNWGYNIVQEVNDEGILIDAAGNTEYGTVPSFGNSLSQPMGGGYGLFCKGENIVYVLDYDFCAIRVIHPETLQINSFPTLPPTTMRPSFSPSYRPGYVFPTLEPTQEPTEEPTFQPSEQPTMSPTTEPTYSPTFQPSIEPTFIPTKIPTVTPTHCPSVSPIVSPTMEPTATPTFTPTNSPSENPSVPPTFTPSEMPTLEPTHSPTLEPTAIPTVEPTAHPTLEPTYAPTSLPTVDPTPSPTNEPSVIPTVVPTSEPTFEPTFEPTPAPTVSPTYSPTTLPSVDPTFSPTHEPTVEPTAVPSTIPSSEPTFEPTTAPTDAPTISPTYSPTILPTIDPTPSPTCEPSIEPTLQPSIEPTVSTHEPSFTPTERPTELPTVSPSASPTISPTDEPSIMPTVATFQPTLSPSRQPTTTNPPTFQPSLGAFETAKPTLTEDETWRLIIAAAASFFASTANRTSIDASFSRSLTYYDTSSLIPSVSANVRGGCNAWNSFSAVQLQTSLFSFGVGYIRLNSISSTSQSKVVSCPNSAVATSIVRAIQSGSNSSIICDSHVWKVGLCEGSVRLCTDCTALCSPITLEASSVMMSPCAPPSTKYFQMLDIGLFAPNPAPAVLSVTAAAVDRMSVTVSVQTSGKGRVFVAVFPAQSSAPTSTEIVKRQNLMSLQSDANNITTIVVRGLIPATNYVAYVLTESTKSGATLSLSSMLRTVTSVRTACCKELKITSASSVLLEGTSYSNLLRVTIDSLPSRNVTSTFYLTNVESSEEVHPFIPSTLIWSPMTLTTQSLSLTGSVGPGIYSVGIRLSGDNAGEYFASFNGNIEVISAESPLPAPTLSAAVFSGDGDYATATFSGQTDFGGLPPSFLCSRLLAFHCAETSICSWVDSQVLRIGVTTLDTCAKPGDNLLLLAGNQIRAACPAGKTCRNQNSWAVSSSVNISIAAPSVATLPTVQISAPSVIGTCSKYVLDVSSSIGNGGRTWQSVNVDVSVSGGDDSGAYVNISSLLTFVKQNFQISPPTRIHSDLFVPGNSYLFTVTLCNFLSACSSATTTVSVISNVVPTVAIPGSSYIETTTSESFSIAGDARINSCNGGSSTTVGLTTSWSVNVDGSPTEIISTSRNPYTFSVSPFTLQIGKLYEVTFTATVAGGKSASSAVQVYVARGSLQAIIAGSDKQSVRVQETLTLDGSSSKDEDIPAQASSDLLFSWTCTQSYPVIADNCENVLEMDAFTSSANAAKVVIRSLASAVSSVIQVSLMVSDKTLSRTAATSVSVEILPALSTTVTITTLTNSLENKINPSDELQLVAQVSVPPATVGNVSWALDSNSGLTLANIVSTPLSQTWSSKLESQAMTVFLRLLPNTLSAGVSYNFKLFSFLQYPGISSVASINIAVNRPPQPGRFDMSPKEGIEFSEFFTFSCSNWVDSDLPIQYQFSYETNTGSNLVVKSVSRASFQTLTIPSGNATQNYSVSCIAEVFDGYMAVTTVYNTIKVSPTPTFSSEDQNSLTSSSLDTAASENPDEIKQSAAIAGYLLNIVNCTLAPNCANLNRNPCTKVDHSCGSCLSDEYIGAPFDSNEPCFTLSQMEQRRRLLTQEELPLKTCPGGCSGHGTCQFKSRVTRKLVPTCYENEFDCYAECLCDVEYSGSASCGVTLTDLEAKLSFRETLLDRVANLLNLEDISKQSMKTIIEYLVIAAQNPHELSDAFKDKAFVMVKEILDNVDSYSIDVSDMSNLFAVLDNLSASMALDTTAPSNSEARKLRQRRRRLQETAGSSMFQNLFNSLLQFGASIANQSLPGQTLDAIVSTNYRLTSGSFPSNCERNETIVLPLSGLEQFLGLTSNQLDIPLCTVNSSALQMTSVMLSSALLDTVEAMFDSDLMSLSLSSLPCQPSSANDCRTTFVLQRNNGFPALANLTSSIPQEFTTVCSEGVSEVIQYPCGDGVADAVVQCNGTAVEVVSRCDVLWEAPTCAAMLNSTLTNLDMSFSNENLPSFMCETIATTMDNITCSCLLSAPEVATNGMLGSAVANNNAMPSTSPSAAKVSVNYVSMMKATSQTFVSTVRSAQGLDEQTLKQSSTAFLLVGLVALGMISAIVYARYLDQVSAQVHTTAEKKLKDDNKHKIASALAKSLKLKTRINPAISQAVVASKAGKNKLSSTGQDGKPLILEMAQEALPSILGSKSITTKVKDEVKRHHRWIGVVFYYSEDFPRALRVLSLATNMIIMLFMQSLTYNLTNDNEGNCIYNTNEMDCLSKKSPYQTGASMCTWQVSPDTASGSCQLVQPDNKLDIVLFVAIFSALMSTPIAFFSEWIISSVLSAPTTDPSKATNTKKKNKVTDGKELERQLSGSNSSNSSPMNNTNNTSTVTGVGKKKMSTAIVKEYVSLSNELCQYYNGLVVPDEKKEFQEIWGLDANGHLPPLSPKIRSRIEASVLLSIETQQNSLTTTSKKGVFQRCFGKKGDAESLVSDLIFLELRSLRSELHKEEKLLERHVLSNREINKRLLYLFQRDLLPGLQGEILDDKCRRDHGMLVQTRSQVMQRMGWAFLMLLNGCMLFYVLLFAAQQEPHRQRAWAQSFALWLVMEICLTSTLTVLLKHVLIPMMLMSDISKIQHKLVDTIVAFYRQMAQQQQTQQQQPTNPSDESKELVAVDAKAASFNAASYLFLSYKVAKRVKNSNVAKIILNYSTPWPKQTYRHKTNVQAGYSRKFAAISRSLSLVVLYFLSNLIVVPVSVQDMVMHMVTTVTAGYTVLIHLQLYQVYPVLIVVPTLCIGAIVHFFVKSQAGQAQIERSKLLQKIVDVGYPMTAWATTSTMREKLPPKDETTAVAVVAATESLAVSQQDSYARHTEKTDNLRAATSTDQDTTDTSAVDHRRQAIQEGLYYTAAMHSAMVQQAKDKQDFAYFEIEEEDDNDDMNDDDLENDHFRAYLKMIEEEEEQEKGRLGYNNNHNKSGGVDDCESWDSDDSFAFSAMSSLNEDIEEAETEQYPPPAATAAVYHSNDQQESKATALEDIAPLHLPSSPTSSFAPMSFDRAVAVPHYNRYLSEEPEEGEEEDDEIGYFHPMSSPPHTRTTVQEGHAPFHLPSSSVSSTMTFSSGVSSTNGSFSGPHYQYQQSQSYSHEYEHQQTPLPAAQVNAEENHHEFLQDNNEDSPYYHYRD